MILSLRKMTSIIALAMTTAAPTALHEVLSAAQDAEPPLPETSPPPELQLPTPPQLPRADFDAPAEPPQPDDEQWVEDDQDPARAQQERNQELEEREQELQQREREWARELQQRERERADRLYESGTRALDKRQWGEAAKLFAEVIEQGGQRSEGAYYWKAYGEYKQAPRDQALATLGELFKRYPEGCWLNDARQLEVEVRQASGQPVDPADQADEELKLMALNGLVEADPERTVPLLGKVIEGPQPRNVKERALFILSQSDSPKAGEILGEFARGKANPDVQSKALEYLALFGGKDAPRFWPTRTPPRRTQRLSDPFSGFS